MKENRTTSEQAACMTPTTRGGFTSVQMLCAIQDIRNNNPGLAAYLKNTEIIVGLGEGRFGPNGLKRRLSELAAIDEGNFEP